MREGGIPLGKKNSSVVRDAYQRMSACVTPTLSVPHAVVAEHTCTCAYIYGCAAYVHKRACAQMRHVHVHGYIYALCGPGQ